MAASMAMTASFLGIRQAPAGISNRRSSVVMAKASSTVMKIENQEEEEKKSSGRRELVFAAAAAAVCGVAKIAMADEEPKRGSPEAKKKYAQVCVTNPTARICRY
ncbi:photosystem II 5 kDa protein, chloroplastic-like [Impatiens glandulifera]|uniref:photosystem II 5 kDa protein, chloroplastic-like n=1 Tax=Impatiens glandulifera TaxID=253017 RepID=UPI001FB0713B|nr:photosystem II 5 kDa protein, chloroplastic-like [Impatiens glandulifera]